MTEDKTCPALVCTCGGAPFTPETARGLSPDTLLAMVGPDAIKRGVAQPLPAVGVLREDSEVGAFYRKSAEASARHWEAVRKLIDERIEAALGQLADTIQYGSESRLKVDPPRQQPLKESVPSDPFGHAADVLDREAEERRIDSAVKQAAQITKFANALIDELGLDRKRAAGVLHRLADSCSCPMPNRRETPTED